MMTLVLITVLMGIVTLILAQSSRLAQQSDTSFVHSAAMRVLNDLERELPSLLSSITGPEQLDLAMRIPFQIESKGGAFSLNATLDSPYGRININQLLNKDGAINEPYFKAFMNLFSLYPITDTDIFFKLVFDTIDTDIAERGVNTEIALIWPDFKNGPIANRLQFEKIMERYIELTGDTKILTIPWNTYVGFEGEKMDFNAVSSDVLSLVVPTLPAEKGRALTLYRTKAYESKEELVAAEPILASDFDTYFFIYKQNEPYTLLCDVQLQENSHKNHIKFQYNLLDKKIKQVEFL